MIYPYLYEFYPPKGTEGGPIVFTYVLFCVRKSILDFQFTDGFCLFETLKMFYPPKGLCKADTEGGPIVFTYVLFWLRKRILDFQFIGGFLPFWELEKVLSPGGTLQSRARKGPNCFYLCFIPRMDSAKQIPKEVLLFLLISYFALGNVCWTFNLLTVFCLFETLKMFYPL